MRSIIAAVILILGPMAFGEQVTVSLKSIDTALANIANHAQEFPPRFTSTAERKQIEAELRDLLTTLDAAVVQYPDDPEILFRDGCANAMGHNLDFEGCAPKYFKAFDRLLELKPEDKRANYNYGAFLAATATRHKDSIKYLEKALALGVFDAHYTLGFAYLAQGDKSKALLHFKEYAKQHPTDEGLRQKIAEIERANIRFVQGIPPGFGETMKKPEPNPEGCVPR